MENPDPSEPGGGPGSIEETVPSIEESPPIQTCLVQQEEGIIDTDYPLGGIALSEEAEELCAIIAIAFVQSKLLVAVPEEAWHRQTDQKETPVQNPFKGRALCCGSLQQRSKRRRGRYHPGDTSLGGLPRSQDGERAEVSAGPWIGPSLRVSERRVFGSLRAGPCRGRQRTLRLCHCGVWRTWSPPSSNNSGRKVEPTGEDDRRSECKSVQF